MTQPDVTVGVIGCGVVSDSHAGAYRAIPGVRLGWACDLRPDRAERLAGAYDIPRRTTRYLEVLDDPKLDAVSICTDHASHAEIAVAAIERGKHVLCEKALAERSANLRRMLEAHRTRPGVVFSGVFQHRFDPIYRELRCLAAEGMFGRLLLVNLQMLCRRNDAYYRGDAWRGTWAGEGGAVLINQAIHFLDQLRWVGGEIAAVCGRYENLTHGDSMETEDTVAAALRYRNGALGVLSATCSSPVNFEPMVSLSGTEGSVDVRSGREIAVRMPDGDAARQVRERLAARVEDLDARRAKAYYGMGHGAQITDFVEAIREGRSPGVTAASAAATVEVVLAVYRSHREGGWIEPGVHGSGAE